MSHVEGSEVVRASLWMRPTGDAFDRIMNAVRLVHQRCGGPEAKPHVSLLGGIESTRADADRRLKKLAARIKPFPIELGDIGWRDEYFRCLYINVLMSRELEEAHRLAHDLFEMNPPEPYEPHISLYYGELDVPTKRKLAEEIGVLDVGFTARSVHLVNAAAGIPIAEWRTLTERRFSTRGKADDTQAAPGLSR